LKKVTLHDIVLDTNILSDFLAQYFASGSRRSPVFHKQGFISLELAQGMNKIIQWWNDPFINQHPGHLVASTLAFVEIARKWDYIVRERFDVVQMAVFIEQPPEWFIIEPLDEALVSLLCDVPADVQMTQGGIRSIEWTDAVHIATAFIRGPGTRLAVTDREMRQVPGLEHYLI
jgi:predicted nucleic acid-binding protein